MASPSYKSKGGKHDSAAKNSFNSAAETHAPNSQVPGGEQASDPKRNSGQFGDKGTAPLMKK